MVTENPLLAMGETTVAEGVGGFGELDSTCRPAFSFARRSLMKCLLVCLVGVALFLSPANADDWHPDDDTFDPNITSVVIGDRSWIGDPSPFLHTGTPRVGYTHVNAVAYQGFDPSVQISLMVPLEPGEKTPPAGGMMMLNKAQASTLIQAFEAGLKAEPKNKDQRIKIETGFKEADWALTFASEDGQRFLQLENKTKDKTDTYRLTLNATKKLIGALQHSLEKLEAKTKQ